VLPAAGLNQAATGTGRFIGMAKEKRSTAAP
jgi:hypothetical protein